MQIQKSETGALALPSGENSMEKSLKTEGNEPLLGIRSSLSWLEHNTGGEQGGDELGRFFSVSLRTMY